MGGVGFKGLLCRMRTVVTLLVGTVGGGGAAGGGRGGQLAQPFCRGSIITSLLRYTTPFFKAKARLKRTEGLLASAFTAPGGPRIRLESPWEALEGRTVPKANCKVVFCFYEYIAAFMPKQHNRCH